MVTGPQQERLQRALTGASSTAVSNGSFEWLRCANMLVIVASALDRASTTGADLGGQTGPAMSAAFAQTAEGMAGKARELYRGSQALSTAAQAIGAARDGVVVMDEKLPQAPHPGPWVPPVEPDVTAKGTYKGDVEAYETSFNDREERARQLADALDRGFRGSTDVMKSIHGEPDPPVGDGGGSPGGPQPISATPPSDGGRTPTPVGHPTVSVVGEPVRDPDHGTHDPDLPDHTTTHVSGVPTHQVTPPTTLPPDPGTAVPGSGTTGVIGGSGSGGVSAPLAGGLGAVAAGGLAGAAIGGIRGGLVPTGSVPGAAARPIGSSSRAGAPGSLGRGGGAAGTGSPTSRPTGRGAGGRGLGARGGAASPGGGAGGRRGAAGAAGTGAATGRRGGKKDQDEQGRDRDLFDDGQDWIDDADAAPGVID